MGASTVTSSPIGTPVIPSVGEGQGPEWLVQFVLDPPGWINQSLKAIAAIVIVIVAVRLYQQGWRLPFRTQIEMQKVVAHVLAVMIASLAFVTYFDLAFWWDATLGAGLGIGSVFGIQIIGRRLEDRLIWLSSMDSRERVMLAWTTIAIIGLILPEFVGISQHGYLAINTRWYIVVLSFAMALYDGFLIHHEESLSF